MDQIESPSSTTSNGNEWPLMELRIVRRTQIWSGLARVKDYFLTSRRFNELQKHKTPPEFRGRNAGVPGLEPRTKDCSGSGGGAAIIRQKTAYFCDFHDFSLPTDTGQSGCVRRVFGYQSGWLPRNDPRSCTHSPIRIPAPPDPRCVPVLGSLLVALTVRSNPPSLR